MLKAAKMVMLLDMYRSKESKSNGEKFGQSFVNPPDRHHFCYRFWYHHGEGSAARRKQKKIQWAVMKG